MKKLFIVVLLVIGLLIPVVSAYDYEQTFSESKVINGYSDTESSGYRHQNAFSINVLKTNNIQNFQGLKSVVTIFKEKFGNLPQTDHSKSTSVIAKIGSDVIGKGTIGYNVNLNPDGSWKNILYYITFDEFNPGIYAGSQTITLEWDNNIVPIPNSRVDDGWTHFGIFKDSSDNFASSYIVFTANNDNWLRGVYYIYNVNYQWSNTVGINQGDAYLDVTIIKNGGSDVEIIDTVTGQTVYKNSTGADITTRVFSQNINVTITSPTKQIYYCLFPDSESPQPSGSNKITVYVKDAQTGALIANAHISISANVNGEFHEVVNETLPAGTKTYYLQPTGGGLPNPDFYRLIVTAEGYNSIMPYSDFEADIPTTIYAYMNPIGGAPENENKTFIDFYVRDLNAKPVAGASVKFGVYTLLTNSAGYTIFEVDKDKLYVWTVSKSGYESVTGNIVVGSDARYTINAVISPALTPTTPIPTTPGKPSPTLTGPTGEPVNNLLEWAAAHFGMILGGGLEIGKIFMWLCFTIPAGVYVGSKAKAGAAGFMAGAGIVTLFFVIIGWVPIWLVVILSLIIGLLYAKAFSNIGNGGGR